MFNILATRLVEISPLADIPPFLRVCLEAFALLRQFIRKQEKSFKSDEGAVKYSGRSEAAILARLPLTLLYRRLYNSISPSPRRISDKPSRYEITRLNRTALAETQLQRFYSRKIQTEQRPGGNRTFRLEESEEDKQAA